jgi:hypothetical protein
MADLNAITDFVSVAYNGTLAQWKDYLKNTALLPAAIKDLKIDFDYGHRFGYSSKRLAFSFTPELQKIEQNSELTLGFGYFGDHGKVVWDVGDVRVAANATDPDRLSILRHVAPSADLDDEYKSEWNKLLHQLHPYDGIAQSDNDEMSISSVVAASAGAAPAVLYSAAYVVEGTQPQAAMKTKLDLLMKNLHVDEH